MSTLLSATGSSDALGLLLRSASRMTQHLATREATNECGRRKGSEKAETLFKLGHRMEDRPTGPLGESPVIDW